jgi:diguanylate cyclase (GGDEF)-like protein
MASTGEILLSNIDLLKSRVNRYGLFGLLLSLFTVVFATIIVAFQMTGEINLSSLSYAQDNNFALRILNFMPFVFVFWGQYIGNDIAYRAGAIIVEETDDLRAETTSWKKKSLHDATHDTLTQLPNRALFYDLLRQAILVATRENKMSAILFMDLDGFQEVNDTFGHNNGDLILKHLSTRIHGLIQSEDIIARMGGDEFAILLTEVPSADVATNIAQRIQKALESPFILDQSNIEIGMSIGIALYPEHGDDVDSLIQKAEIAMSAAKRSQNGYEIYSSSLNQDNPRRMMLMSDLRQAIDNNQLELYYQPKIDIKSETILSVEVLVRWTHAEHGRISPAEFIPLAERSRLIKPLTKWIITKSMSESERWHKDGVNIGMAINLSARDLNDPDLPGIFTRMLATYDVNPEWFTLEITESSIMNDPVRALGILNQLSSMNFRLSIDDFGTGYSSLAYLSRLPVQELKIDQTFVMGMAENKNDSLIVSSTIDLGHNMGLKVIAEGVENEITWQLLKDSSCDIVQGYYISPPLNKIDFFKWLQDSRWGLSSTDQLANA